MTEPRFHSPRTALDLDRLIALTGATPARPDAASLAITGVASLEWAGPRDLACVDGHADPSALAQTGAGAVLLEASLAAELPAGSFGLISAAPARDFARIVAVLYPEAARPPAMFGAGVAAGAVIHPQARIETGASVAPGAVVGPGAVIGRGTDIGANAVIGAGVQIGRDGMIGDGAVIRHALIGDRVSIRGGSVVGDCAGDPHPAAAVGRVVVQDGVEIGPNAAVARGRLGDTVLGEGARIDALVRIGPDARIGRHCFIAAAVAAGAVVADHASVFGIQAAP